MQAPLTQYKNIDHVGFVLANTHALGLSYGQTFDLDGDGNTQLDDLPLVEDGATVDRLDLGELRQAQHGVRRPLGVRPAHLPASPGAAALHGDGGRGVGG
jgi:hypothetical protein